MRKPLFMLAMFLPLSVMAQVFSVQSVEQVTLPDGCEMVADISPDGNRLLLTTGAHEGLKSFEPSSGKTVVLTNSEGAGYEARFAADGNTVLYRETTFTPKHLRMTSLNTVDLNTGSKLVLQDATRDLQGVRLNGSNAMIVNKGKLKAKSFNGKKAEKQPVLSISNRQLMLTKNGKTAVFSPNGTDHSYIWPSLSPDGQKVLYYVCGVGAFVCDLNGKNIKSLGTLRAPKWYDDSIVIGMNDQDNGEVVVSSAIVASTLDGTQQTLTDNSVIAQYPKPAPMAGKIAFTTPAGQAYIINVSK